MVTIHDVARASGVAISTVSNVLTNANRPVSAAVREKVLRAAQDLNYYPNTTAQALVRRRTDTIGVVSALVSASEIATNSYILGIMQGILAAAEEAQQNVTLYTHHWRGARESSPVFRDRRTDGLLLIVPPTDSDILAALSSLSVPLVTVSAIEVAGVPSVDVDDRMGASLAVAHLADLGHRRIAYIQGNENHVSTRHRLGGFLTEMAARGLEMPADAIRSADYDGGGAAEACAALLERPERPTALFAANDNIAVAALRAAKDMGLRVPGDLSIIGYDDAPSAALVTPALTTIRQPLAAMGAAAARTLARVIDGKESVEMRQLLQPELVVRESTAPIGRSA
ncbi:LacI family transcriptional regulator [Capsulimonas corticalis]|uniref:LacI family transcriptional regulator n=1 Tax=Capsulimonas corticalis TaxID=2219043 RepID=A0A402CZZ5_9BACT|nr:LacI family DNA-binding transcriptional regulator [Capsulimonas corticalis]BDI33781.1 LacI family transcriptional regulator [Capsulimonas corticalis]